MPPENVIHIRLDYMEALKARRGILSSELSALNIAKRISRYKAVRMEELSMKMQLYSKMKEVKSNIRKLHIVLPNPEMPKILKKEKHMEHVFGKEDKKVVKQEEDIDSQLREIQRRLERLQSDSN